MSYTIVFEIPDYRDAKKLWNLKDFLPPHLYYGEFQSDGVRIARDGWPSPMPTEVDQEFVKAWERQTEANRVEASRHDPQNIVWNNIQ